MPEFSELSGFPELEPAELPQKATDLSKIKHMFSSQSMNTESESSDNMSTPTPTLKGKPFTQKTFAFTTSNNSSASIFTYTKNSKAVDKLSKTNINNKKRKIVKTLKKPKVSTRQTEIMSSDTEEENLTALHNAAKRALQKVLSKVETERKVKVKQALYHLEKALTQVKVESPLKIQLKQLNTKIDLFLHKQESTSITTQKMVNKAVEIAQEQAQVQEQIKTAASKTVQKQSTKTNLT